MDVGKRDRGGGIIIGGDRVKKNRVKETTRLMKEDTVCVMCTVFVSLMGVVVALTYFATELSH